MYRRRNSRDSVVRRSSELLSSNSPSLTSSSRAIRLKESTTMPISSPGIVGNTVGEIAAGELVRALKQELQGNADLLGEMRSRHTATNVTSSVRARKDDTMEVLSTLRRLVDLEILLVVLSDELGALEQALGKGRPLPRPAGGLRPRR